MVTLAAPQIRPLVVGELLTVVYGYGPDRFWQTGQYLGRTTDEHGREWLDLSDHGLAVMAIQVEHVVEIERHGAPGKLSKTRNSVDITP
jgi:hypothetical protein